MSFSVSCGGCGLEWSGRRPFAQPRNIARPRFHRFLLEVARWLRSAASTLDTAEGLSLGQYAARHGYSERFRSHFLVPLTSALWSTAPERALEFPAAALPADADAGDDAHPLAGAQALAQARAVPPQAAVRPRERVGPAVIERTVRPVPAARGGALERVAVSVLERALAGLDEGTLVAGLPDGGERPFGSGPPRRWRSATRAD